MSRAGYSSPRSTRIATGYRLLSLLPVQQYTPRSYMDFEDFTLYAQYRAGHTGSQASPWRLPPLLAWLPSSPRRLMDDVTLLFAHYTAPPYRSYATPGNNSHRPVAAQWPTGYRRTHRAKYLDLEAFKLFAHYSAAAVQ